MTVGPFDSCSTENVVGVTKSRWKICTVTLDLDITEFFAKHLVNFQTIQSANVELAYVCSV